MKQLLFSLLLLMLLPQLWAKAQVSLPKQRTIPPQDKVLYESYRLKVNYFVENNKDSTLFYTIKAINITDKYPNSKEQASIYVFYAFLLTTNLEYTKAESYINKAMKILQNFPHRAVELMAFTTMADIYHRQGNNIKAFKLYNSIYQKIQKDDKYDLNDQMRIYQNFAHFYIDIKNEKAAIELIHKGLLVAHKLNNPRQKTLLYINLSDIYLRQSQIDSCTKYTDKGIEVAKIAASNKRLITLYTIKGSILLMEQRNQEAYKILQEAIQLAQKGNFKTELLSANGMLGKYYIQEKEYKLAENKLLEVVKICKQKNMKNTLQWALLSLTTLYKETKEYDKALTYFEEHQASLKLDYSLQQGITEVIKESEEHQRRLLEVEKNLKITQQKSQYQLLEKTHENALLEKQVLEKDNINKNTQIKLNSANIKAKELALMQTNEALHFAEQRQYLFAILLAITAFFFLFIFQSYRKERKLRKIIETQSLALEELNHTKDKIFSMLGHDLRSPIAALKHTLAVWVNLSTDKKQQMIESLYGKVDNLQLVLENLMQWSVIQLGKQNIQVKKIALDQLVRQAILQATDIAEQKDIYMIDKLQSLIITTDEHQLMIVIRNLLHNAIKFTPTQGIISISTYQKGNQAIICIKDTGIGMEENQLAEILQKGISSYGTFGEKGMGIGLEVCQDLIRQLSGKMIIESQLQKGTTVTLKFDINRSDL